MELKWVLPPSQHLYKCKPMNYISHLMSYESKGSLSLYLRKKTLCNRINCNVEQYSIYTVFTLQLILLHKGNESVKEILNAVFSYVNMLRREGTNKRIFDEIKQNKDYKFR